MSTNNFKAIKETLTDSKFMMGKNKVIGVAFGNEEESFKANSFKVANVFFFLTRISKDIASCFSQTRRSKNARRFLIISKRMSSQLEVW